MKYKKIVPVILTIMLTFWKAVPVLADCSPDGTPGDDNITCDTSADSGDVGSDPAYDTDGVHGEGGSDQIAVENGSLVLVVAGDSQSTGGSATDNIILYDGAAVMNGISGDSIDGDNNTGEDSINIDGFTTNVVGDSFEGDNNSGNDNITVGETGDVVTFIGGDSIDGDNNSGADTIINNGSANEISGDSDVGDNNSGDDTIINNDRVFTIFGDSHDGDGNSGDDIIINNDEVDNIFSDSEHFKNDSGNNTVTNNIGGTIYQDIVGGGGNDIITNNGAVNGDIQGKAGNDTIVNSGTVDNDIEGNDGNDSIDVSGMVGGDVNAGDGDDIVNMTGTQIDGIIDGGEGGETVGDTLNFGMSTESEEQFKNAKASIADANPDGGTLAWGNSTYNWKNFEILVDNLVFTGVRTADDTGGDDTGGPATSTIFSDSNMIVNQNRDNGAIYFFGVNGSSNHLIASLSEGDYSGATAGQVLITAANDGLGVLYISSLGNGQLAVQYYSSADGSLLSSAIITV